MSKYEQKINLPEKLIVPCCVGSTCGNRSVYLDATLVEGCVRFGYRRFSNDDWYVGPRTEEEIRQWLVHRPALNEVYTGH